MTYGNKHRFFLRTVASHGVLTLADAKKTLDKVSDQEQIQVQSIVREINEVIRPYQQEIKITNDEVTNEEVVVFISLGYDDATKSQNFFSANELEYFRILIEQIMTTESRQITSTQALNLVGKMKQSFTKVCAEKLLITWCRMRYLDKDETNYALGVRGIHEFEGYLRQNMPDTIEECCLCKQIVFRGYNCPGCAAAAHTRCLNHYLEKVNKWPCCKMEFHRQHLERLVQDSSRLTQTQVLEMTQQSVDYNTIVQPTQVDDSTGDVDLTQDSAMDTSQEQRISKKRKRRDT